MDTRGWPCEPCPFDCHVVQDSGNFVAVHFDDVAQGEPTGFVGEVVNEFVDNTGYFKGDVVVVEMNLVAHSGQHDRGSHVLIVRDSSGIARVEF
jgi:hypothetical protein